MGPTKTEETTMAQYTLHLDIPEPASHLPGGPPHMHFIMEGNFYSMEHAEAMADHIRRANPDYSVNVKAVS
jgi:hypothetical protein